MLLAAEQHSPVASSGFQQHFLHENLIVLGKRSTIADPKRTCKKEVFCKSHCSAQTFILIVAAKRFFPGITLLVKDQYKSWNSPVPAHSFAQLRLNTTPIILSMPPAIIHQANKTAFCNYWIAYTISCPLSADVRWRCMAVHSVLLRRSRWFEDQIGLYLWTFDNHLRWVDNCLQTDRLFSPFPDPPQNPGTLPICQHRRLQDAPIHEKAKTKRCPQICGVW